jgi:hypothetical protein
MSRRGKDGPQPLAAGAAANHEIAEIDDRSRIVLPARLLEGLDWFSDADVVDSLAILTEPGVIRLASGVRYADAIQARRDELALAQRNDDLRLLEDRYRPLQIPKRRPTLGESFMTHLGLTFGEPTKVYVWRVADYLEILSVGARDRKVLEAPKRFPDLP